MDLGTLFEFAARRCPGHVALVEGDKQYTFSALNQEVNRLATSLLRLGVGRRDRVMVLLKNRIETVCIFWAVQKLGAIFTPVNYRMSAKDMYYCIGDVEPKVIFYEKLSGDLVFRSRIKIMPLLISVDNEDGDVMYSELISRGSCNFEMNPHADEDIAIMLYTSGTTGDPKGVPRSHKNEYASSVAHIIQNGYQRHESMFGAMPLHHTMGMRSLITMCILNGKYVITPDFDAAVVLDLLSKERITCLYMIPTMYHQLLKSKHQVDTMDMSSLRKMGYAGSPMSEALIQECRHFFHPDLFVNHYGSTEVYTFTTCSNPQEKPGCAGKPGINQNIRLVAPGINSAPDDVVHPGDIGEVIVHASSDEAFKGYWNRPDLTRQVIRDGWYFTGDLGYLDDDGDLFIVGRVDDMVISGGEHVSPFEVEKALCTSPQVEEVAVIGEQDEHLGQIVVAYVVPASKTLSIQELDSFCKSHTELPAYARPRKYVFIDQLPKGPTGKVLRRALGRSNR